ncbi:MAG: hypothetical protein JXA14_02905 [Anaerolineae bacterium]|nr:hypothetical protein [Anaerolineae bacterium]
MTQTQRIIVIVLGAVSLLTIVVLGAVVLTSMSSLGEQAAPPAPPTHTPTLTPILTWTPTPQPTPTVPPTVVPTSPSTLTPTPPFRSLADDPRLSQIEVQVAALRGLGPLRPVPCWAITTNELRHYYVDPLLDEHWEAQIESWTLALVAFDMLEPGVDVSPLVRYFLPESIAGFYDPGTGGIYIVNDTGVLGESDYSIFAHEYGHALQDQHFDLLSLGFDEIGSTYDHLDRLNAARALVEGDAELLQGQYERAYAGSYEDGHSLDVSGLNLWPAAWNPGGVVSSMQSPPIDDVFLFPYIYGEIFVQDLYDRGGWGAVNEAYADPPASTEHILHPGRYRAGDEPIPVSIVSLADTLGSDWRLVFEDAIGEFMLRVYLQDQLGADEAAKAAAGWGGDLSVVYYNEDVYGLVMVLRSVWDTPAEAEEFLDAYVTYAARRYGHPANDIAGGLSCWYGDDTLCVTGAGGEVTVVLGPDASTVDAVFGAVSE